MILCFFTEILKGQKNIIFINPFNVQYSGYGTVVTLDAVTPQTVENYENSLTFSCKSLKFPTKWYTALCNLVDPVLRNRVKLKFSKLTKYILTRY